LPPGACALDLSSDPRQPVAGADAVESAAEHPVACSRTLTSITSITSPPAGPSLMPSVLHPDVASEHTGSSSSSWSAVSAGCRTPGGTSPATSCSEGVPADAAPAGAPSAASSSRQSRRCRWSLPGFGGDTLASDVLPPSVDELRDSEIAGYLYSTARRTASSDGGSTAPSEGGTEIAMIIKESPFGGGPHPKAAAVAADDADLTMRCVGDTAVGRAGGAAVPTCCASRDAALRRTLAAAGISYGASPAPSGGSR